MHDLKEDVYASYDATLDRTIIWQDLTLGDLVIQTTILGWYYGEPNDESTKQFSLSTTVAQYF